MLGLLCFAEQCLAITRAEEGESQGLSRRFAPHTDKPVDVAPLDRDVEKTKAHVFVVMLAYLISRQLKKLWATINLTVQEAINELACISSDEIKVGTISYQSIQEPRDLGKQLLEACNISLPAALPFKNVTVAIRKKLMSQRKSK